MSEYIRLYQDVMDEDVCQSLISKFNSEDSVQRSSPIMNFTEINITQSKGWEQYNEYLTYNFRKVVEQYKAELGTYWPSKFAFEEFRMKRYEPNVGKFDTHVDVGDYSSARRFLVLFAYLNDGAGGETSFDSRGIVIPRNRGSVLVFPPLWTHPHSGRTPEGDPKYIIGTYLHYV